MQSFSSIHILPFAWYQGESNLDECDGYRELLKSHIKGWRKLFQQGDLPFAVISIAGHEGRKPKVPGVYDSQKARIRDAQYKIRLDLPEIGYVNTIDLGEEKNVHPKNKQDVGLRLCIDVLHRFYKEGPAAEYPAFAEMKKSDTRVLIKFKNTGGGLVIKGDGKVSGFTVAGEDRIWFEAEAELKGDEVLVNSDKVKKITAVRYAWANFPAVNIYSKTGLPAVPFRTDKWELNMEPQK
ncbi:MAG: sialate O-acetylesterase [Planctomycetota bacterium]